MINKHLGVLSMSFSTQLMAFLAPFGGGGQKGPKSAVKSYFFLLAFSSITSLSYVRVPSGALGTLVVINYDASHFHTTNTFQCPSGTNEWCTVCTC